MSQTIVRTALLLLLVSSTLLAGCGTASPRTVAGAEAVGMLANRTVIDVRTPGEFASGHIAGAVNIDVQASDFAARIAELDKETAYFVYCRSGNRSAAAARQMADAGFKDIVDGGGLEDLLAAGAPRG